MKYIDGFRDPEAARAVRLQIEDLAGTFSQERSALRIMEVCGTHTVAIARCGIRTVLPKNLDLISGPGCPVCVTDSGYIDAALALARKGVLIATFGDMIKVPGSECSLAQARSEGALVEICYSPLDAVKLAAQNPKREVVFLGVGFETTTGPVVSIIPQAQKASLHNISILTAFKTVPPALHALASDRGIRINAFLCPAHVSAVIGASAYETIASCYSLPCVIAGFEPLDIFLGIKGILQQLAEGRAEVENQYKRVVRYGGNLKAQSVMQQYLEPCDAAWRGIGTIPGSGLTLKAEYRDYDAALRYELQIERGAMPSGCRCGDVLKGIIKPPQCGAFGKGCTPEHPVGPCMVSSEGSCAAYYKFREAV